MGFRRRRPLSQMTAEQAAAAVMSFLRKLYQAGYLLIEDAEDGQ